MSQEAKKVFRILVVDDNSYQRKLQEELLSNEGYEVVTAANGREALNLLEHESVSLIISDILMPEMDGFTFCHKVKQNPKQAAIPFVFYTASYVDVQDRELGDSLGVDLYLIKPTPVDEFLGAIRTLLEKRWAIKEKVEQVIEEKTYLQKYTERVSSKLEEKVRELEAAYELLQKEKENLSAFHARLIEADRSKAAFFCRVSHELRTPLTGILGYADLLLEKAKTDDEKHYLEKIVEYGRSLESQLTGILEYMDYEEGKITVFLEKFNPEELLNQVYEEMRPLTQSKKLEFDRNIPTPLPRIKADRPSFLRIINQLLQNAIKFTPAGKVALSVQVVPDYLAVIVADTGIGIRKEDQKRIFAGFEQAEDYLTRTYKGIGLGLALTQKLLELNNGKITLQSEPGKGSTFTVFFPLAD